MSVGSRIALTALACAMAPVLAEGALINGYESLTSVAPATGVTVSLGTIGVTQGSTSIKVTVDGGYQNAVNNDSGAFLKAIKTCYATNGSAVIKLDFTAPANAPDWWFQFAIAFQGDGQGWQQSPLLLNDGGPIATRTLSWNATSALNPTGTANPVWGQILFVTNNGPAGHIFYVDNLRVEAVPEPAMIGLCGLSGLVLLRRARSL